MVASVLFCTSVVLGDEITPLGSSEHIPCPYHLLKTHLFYILRNPTSCAVLQHAATRPVPYAHHASPKPSNFDFSRDLRGVTPSNNALLGGRMRSHIPDFQWLKELWRIQDSWRSKPFDSQSIETWRIGDYTALVEVPRQVFLTKCLGQVEPNIMHMTLTWSNSFTTSASWNFIAQGSSRLNRIRFRVTHGPLPHPLSLTAPNFDD
ncbi:hypothetical protein C8J56DRAFT_951514 [Mycena floridula]|nr:hypothetical protein C8J56DRAFT_951514 [Mycena floridula]